MPKYKEHFLAYPHIEFEENFKKICEEKGYKLTDISYHHNYKDETMGDLRINTSPVSLSIRLVPDFIVSKDGDTKFYELKTG